MSAINWSSLNFTGTPDDEDRRAAKYLIRIENTRRAALDPPETPLPNSTGAEIKASVISIANDTISVHWWPSIIEKSVGDDAGITPEEKQAILAAIRNRLDNGESAASIITDIQS